MRILFGTDNFYPNIGGGANFNYALAKNLAKNGHQVFIIAPAEKFEYLVKKQEHGGVTIYGIHSVGVPKIIHPARPRIPLPINPFKIKALVSEINPEVIHIQDHFIISSMVAAAGRKLGIPLVGTNHFMPENFMHYLYPPKFAKIPLSKLAWKHFIKVYKHLSLVTTPTKAAAKLLRDVGLKNRVISISCGVDLVRFNPRNNGDYLKKRYQITSSDSVVLFVGRLDKEKNINILIKAFAQVLDSLNAKLIIAGKGKEQKNLVNLCKKLKIEKDVIFTGYISEKDLPNLYRIADLFAIASIAELQSLVTMEAMACGLPVVAAKVMALPELVHHGKNGYLFSDGDTNTLTNQMIKILKNPSLSKKMSEDSLRIIKHHDVNKTIKSYEKIYLGLGKTRKHASALSL